MNALALVFDILPLLLTPIGSALVLAELLDRPYGLWLIVVVGIEFGLLICSIPDMELITLEFTEASKLLGACAFSGTAAGFFLITRILKRKDIANSNGEINPERNTESAAHESQV